MKLLDKTLVIICITLVGMVLLMYVASQVILMGSYSSMEKADVSGKLDSSLRAINYDLSMLDTINVDYAYWNDTYRFVAEPYITEDAPYVTSNLVDTTFEMQRLNIVLFLDSADNIRYARTYDLDNERFVDMPDGFGEVLKQGSPLLRSGKDDSIHGVVLLHDKPMLVSAYPIKSSDGNSPTRGTMIMGRFLDEKGIRTLGNITGLSMELMPYSGTALPEDYRNALPKLGEKGSVIVEPINDTRVAGYTIIDDVFGKPALILRVDEPRSMYLQGQNSVIYYILSLIFAGVVFINITVFLIEKTVISRIAQLSKTVHLIGARDDPSTRVHVSGNDEVSLLAETINSTLDSLQSSREKLFASEQKFRGLVENIGDIVLEVNNQYEFTYISPNVTKILGYGPEEVIGKSIYDFIGTEAAAGLKYRNIRLFETDSPISLIDLELLDKEGRLVDIEMSGTKTFDPQGRIIGFHGVARDVRERKLIEGTMRKWADIFQMARIPITISGPEDTRLDMVNPAFSQMYGYDARDLSYMRFEDIFDPMYRKDLHRHMNLADSEGHYVFESRHVRSDGLAFPVTIDISVVKDTYGKVLYRIINVQDITERKHVEEVLQAANDELEARVKQRTVELMKSNKALQYSEAKYRELVQYANSVILRIDIHGNITYFNEFASGFFGFSAEEVMGRNVIDTIVPPTDLAGTDLKAMVRNLLRYPENFAQNENENVRKNGERVWVSWTNKVILDKDGRIEGILSIGNDITDLKKLTEELRQANDQLDIRVQQRTADLAKVVHALQEEVAERKRVEEQMASSLKEKEVLLKEIHHRVKNNLQIISSLLSLQSGTMNKESAAMFMESQNRIKSMALIHEKLYQSRDLSHIDFSGYVGNLTAYLARSYSSNQSVHISIDISEISLGIDMAIPCGLIINELVSNSLKYAFRDGKAGEIRIRMVIDGGKYVLTVSDDGVGLPEGLDFRNSPSLGLQLVCTLVDQIEGTIELENGPGSTFTIQFAEGRP